MSFKYCLLIATTLWKTANLTCQNLTNTIKLLKNYFDPQKI